MLVELFDEELTQRPITLPPVSAVEMRLMGHLIRHSGDYHSTLSKIIADLVFYTRSETGYVLNEQLQLPHQPEFDPLCTDYIIISNNPGKDPRMNHPRKIRTYLSIPLIHQEVIMGHLILCNRLEPYQEEDLLPLFPMCQVLALILYFVEKGDLTEEIMRKKEGDDTKDRFLSIISHEIRTPLNGIVGMADMLFESGGLTKKQMEYLTILLDCSHQLMSLLNNILDFSKLSSHRLTLLTNPLEISKIIQDAVTMVEGKASTKGLELRVDLQPQIPSLLGDAQRLTQVLTNLLSNAVKFTEKGSIQLRVKGKGEENGCSKRWTVTFEVEDTGPGIPLKDQEKIFESFHQSEPLHQKLINHGTGLGLSIARELVKLMGGNISVFSEPGKGSLFTFFVQLDEEIQLERLQEKHRTLLEGSRVLIVDDRTEYRLQLTDMLFKWGCTPVAVGSGEEALQYLSHQTNFDVVFVDICMPYMNGVELAQELRSAYRSIPLIGLSSVELSGGEEMFDHYMNKPIEQHLLFPALLDCLAKKKESIVSAPRSERQAIPKNKVKILIAEDDHNNAFTLREMLLCLGYTEDQISVVENGEKCVEEVKRVCYDVILMDIIMPVMDGIEAIKHIRQIKNHPYIIAVSAAIQNTDKQRCQRVGVDGYLSKPIIKEKLESILNSLFSR